MHNNCEDSIIFVGNSVDIDFHNPDLCKSSEIRSDIVIEEYMAKRIWGQVLNCNGQPIPNALVKLVRVECACGGAAEYIGIAHSITDCQGFYQFDVCPDKDICYKIVVNKATIGYEAVMLNDGGNCGLCNADSCNICNAQGYNPCCGNKRHAAPSYLPCSCQGERCYIEGSYGGIVGCQYAEENNECLRCGAGNGAQYSDGRYQCGGCGNTDEEYCGHSRWGEEFVRNAHSYKQYVPHSKNINNNNSSTFTE